VITTMTVHAPVTIITARPLEQPVADWLDHFFSTETCQRIKLVAMGDHDDKQRYIKEHNLKFLSMIEWKPACNWPRQTSLPSYTDNRGTMTNTSSKVSVTGRKSVSCSTNRKRHMRCPHCQEKIQLYRNPVPTVDIIIEVDKSIVLIRRKNPPHGWALPGGFVDYGESYETAAIREAEEETGLAVQNLQQFRTYSAPDRDPRQHTASTVLLPRPISRQWQEMMQQKQNFYRKQLTRTGI